MDRSYYQSSNVASHDRTGGGFIHTSCVARCEADFYLGEHTVETQLRMAEGSCIEERSTAITQTMFSEIAVSQNEARRCDPRSLAINVRIMCPRWSRTAGRHLDGSLRTIRARMVACSEPSARRFPLGHVQGQDEERGQTSRVING
jgi:hypothetical protein